MLLRSIACLLGLAGAAAAAAAPAPRAPTGKRVVNFDAAQCVAHRQYGSAESPLRLVLKAPPLGDVMQIAVMRPGGTALPEQVDSTVSIDGRRPLRTNLVMYTPKDGKERVYLLNMPSAEFALVREAKAFSIRSSGLNETLALSQMPRLLKIMDECVANLRQVWNVAGEDGVTRLGARARANLASYFSPNDYPGVSIAKGQSGRVKFALLVAEDGSIADCTIVETSGAAALDTQVCAVLRKKAKFEPARDADGKPAKDSVFSAVLWKLP